MSNDKTYDRHVNIWINGKEVKNSLSDIKKEMYNLANETNRAVKGSDEYNRKVEELRRVKQIYKEHKADIDGTTGSWTKLKTMFSSAQGMIVAGIAGITAGYQALKGIITSTDALGDKFDITLGGWKGGLDALKRSLASINEGGLKNLGKSIREGIEEGRRYAQSLDEVDEKMRALKIAEAETSNEILRQTKISRSAKSTKDEQIAAGQKIIQLEEDLAGIRTGIAEQAFNNEASNIASITGLTEKEVMAYVKQEAAIVAQIEAGRKYNEAIRDRNSLQAIMSTNAGKLTDSQKARWKEVNITINNASAELLRFANAANKMPGDDKMQMFVDKYVALQQAMGSALENTMRTQIRTDKNEVELNKNSIKGIKDKTDAEIQAALDWQQIQSDVAEYTENLDKEYFKRLDEKVEKERQAALETAEIQADVMEYIENLDKEYFERQDKQRKEQEDADKQLYQAKRQVLDDAMRLESVLFDRKFAKLDEQYRLDIQAAGDNAAAKAKIEEEYNNKRNKLARRAAIVEKAAAIFSIGLDTAKGVMNAMSKIVTMPLVPWIIASGAIQAAIVAAQPVPKYRYGGFTGQGDKYEPAGIVHKGEWIGNSEMVNSPVTGPIIQALEQSRVSGSYAVGGMAGSTGASSQGSTPAPFIASDPEMKALIRQNIQINRMLLRDGVKTNFTYNDVDDIRKGMSKLQEVEDSVTM